MLKNSVYSAEFARFSYLCFTNVLRNRKLPENVRKMLVEKNTHQDNYGYSNMGGDEAPQEG